MINDKAIGNRPTNPPTADQANRTASVSLRTDRDGCALEQHRDERLRFLSQDHPSFEVEIRRRSHRSALTASLKNIMELIGLGRSVKTLPISSIYRGS